MIDVGSESVCRGAGMVDIRRFLSFVLVVRSCYHFSVVKGRSVESSMGFSPRNAQYTMKIGVPREHASRSWYSW
jgi:hypothetical protein